MRVRVRDRLGGDRMLNKLKKNSKLWIIVIGAVAGVALLLLGGGDGGETVRVESDDAALATYTKSVEEKIHEICSRVSGVSDVSVAVSFESGFEYVYAKNEDKGDIIVIGSGSAKSAVKITEIPPEIKGIGVVCRGGGDPIVQNKLLNLLSATFGISTNKIYITEAKK